MATGAAAERVMSFGVRSGSSLFPFEQERARKRIASPGRMNARYFFMSLFVSKYWI